MTGLLLALWLTQAGAQGTGVVTGIVRGANGTPASGIRVYAVAVRDAAEAAAAPTALESIAQTDAGGRYRLEVTAGRYYIASGSVGSPTYFPGTTNVANARVISIAAGGLTENIDFSSFVPPSLTGALGLNPVPPLPPGSTGVLEGTVRFADGTAAAGFQVVAIPKAAIPQSGAINSIRMIAVNSGIPGTTSIRRIVNNYNLGQSQTDANGRFRIESLPPETYYMVTGYADAPQFFPGTTDMLVAKTFTTTPTTRESALDFVIPSPTAGVSISGRVTALAGAPAGGATVQIDSRTMNNTPFFPFGLLSRPLRTSATVAGDGTFETPPLFPGTYTVSAGGFGVGSESRTITIKDQAVHGVDFSLPVASLTGKILMEDGSPVPNPQLFTEAVLRTVDNPNLILTTIFPISRDGSFSRLTETNTYRFYLVDLPEEYSIVSMTSGTQDLMKETLKLTSAAPATLEVRVALRTNSPVADTVRAGGSIRDNFTGLPTAAERVTLCCFDSGPSERLSSPLRSDGAFEFASVPRGRYELGLKAGPGQPKQLIVDNPVEVEAPVLGMTVLSTPELRQLTVNVVMENGLPLIPEIRPTITFSGSSGRTRIVARRNGNAIYLVSVPAGDRYTVSVSDLPEGYTVKSITGTTEVSRTAPVNSFGGVTIPPILAPTVITIAPGNK